MLFDHHSFREEVTDTLRHMHALMHANHLEITMNQAQEIARINALTDTLNKVFTEQQAQQQALVDLRTQLESAGSVTPEVEAALTRAEDSARKIDDLVPDAPAAAPVETTPTDPTQTPNFGG